MTALTMASFADALQDHYTRSEIARVTYEDRPFLALVRKEEDWKGDKYIQPIVHGTPQGRSKTFATAQANTNPGKYERFEVETVDDYGVVHIDYETMLASEGMPAEYFVQARIAEIDGILDSLGESMATDIFRNTGGARGQRGSVAGTVLTLEDPEDVVNFEVGMKLKASADDGSASGHTLRAGSAPEITSIDRDAGTLTAAAGWGGITSFTDGDYLFVEGDFQGAMAGMSAWCPDTAPGGSDSFFGVNRSVDVTRLAGHRYSDSYPLVEKLQRSLAAHRRHGGRCDIGVANTVHITDLSIALQDKASYEMMESADGLFGFEVLVVRTPKGRVKYIEDPHCPPGRLYHARMEDLKFASRGGAPRVLDPDGVGQVMRRSDDPGVEGRFGYYGNLICENPRNLQVVTGLPY